MAAGSITDLGELLAALGRTRSLRGRLRVLGHAWRLLRDLAPAEREQVALRLGSDWAWKRVEKSFLRDGELDDNEKMIGRIFERLGDSDPTELRAMASAIRDGDRDTTKDMLLSTLQEALEEEAEEATPETADPEPGLAHEVAEREQAQPNLRGTAQDASSGRPATPPRVQPVVATRLVDSGGPTPPASPAPASPWADTSTPRARPRRAETALAVAPAKPISSGSERIRLLRRLREEAHPGGALGPVGRRRLIASLGGGWASRRALSTMIQGASLDDVDEALTLISQLEGNGQRIWCLIDLLEAAPLAADDLEKVLAAAPTDASRRRLARREAR